MEKSFNSAEEMFTLSKYKYINKITKSVVQQSTNILNSKANFVIKENSPLNLKEHKKKEEAELAAKLKAEKKAKMAAACKPNAKKQEKTKFTEKVKYVNDTPIGEKKDMSKPMLDSYDPTYVESAWDDWWAKNKFYEVDLEKAKNVSREKRFIMLLPPPNVTGSLHLGHTLMGAIEDSITRWRRMKGDISLWVPGTDHAGIATQSVVEKKLLKEQGKYRNDFTREEFLEKVWDWKNEYGNRIFNQFKRLGVSFDLSRNFFTMDEPRSEGVIHAFVNLHERGLLYRAERIVHWCCALKTAISDVEIDELKLDGPTILQVPLHKDKYEFGVLVDFAYKLKDDPSKEIIVSTTRIETMLGDVAVAVHPDDFRYKDLIGKELVHPFIPDRHMKIIADSLLVDMTFGTGAVKITPGHDPNDFLCGQRHSLPIITILDDNGILNENAGKYKGMRRYDCRNQILKDLESLGLYKGKKPNEMVLQRCSKTNDIIEPLVKPQWWINCKDVAARGIEDVKSGKLKILPEFQKSMWYEFLEKIRDWCISRQLWWGHRCPAYLVQIDGIIDKPNNSNNDHWIAAKSYVEAKLKAAKKWNVDESKVNLTQDEDVLDTWFSSGLLPLTAFGWPNVGEEFKTFFPTDLLETGHDIIFFWVARMVFMSYFFMDCLPFHTVYLHPIVRDAQGRKMSKSLGNVIDPLEVIDGISLENLINKLYEGNLPENELKRSVEERQKIFPNGIPECGADALRLGLMSYLVQGRNINLDVSRVVSYRFFGNKLWNATKFLLHYTNQEFTYKKIESSDKLSFIDKWILNKLSRVTQNFNRSFENYNFGDATMSIYSFWQDHLCDVYIEAVKPILTNSQNKNISKNVLLHCIESGLKILHPLMPFITEELYQRLPNKEESIVISQFPEEISWIDDEIELLCDKILDITHKILSVLTQFNLKIKPNICIFTKDESLKKVLIEEPVIIATLGRCANVSIIESSEKEGWLLNVINANTDVYLDIKSHIDLHKEIERLQGLLKEKNKYLDDVIVRINKPGYEDKVPEDVKIQNNEKIQKTKIEIDKIEDSIKSLLALNK